MPKVSVIMGVYNCRDKNLLKDSVLSIINQTFKDWEFLICNDGSSDDTLQYIQKIAKLDDRIKILSYSKNKGLAYALNRCVKCSVGNYIARQDDDDISYPDRLEKEVKFLDANPDIVMVGTNTDVYCDDEICGAYIYPEKPTKYSFLWNSPFLHPTIMIRSNVLNACGCYRVAKETKRCEDYDLFMRIYSLGYKGYNIQEKLYKYKIYIDKKKKYRSIRYRIDEAKIRYIGYKKMKILCVGFLFVLKPILIAVIPQNIFGKIRKISLK